MRFGLPSVAVALPDPLLASALAEALAHTCRVVATCGGWSELEDALDDQHPDVAIVDLLVGDDGLLDHLHRLVTVFATTHFVFCSEYLDRVLIERVLVSGAAGIVGHETTLEQLRSVVVATACNRPWPDGCGIPAHVHSRRAAPIRPLTPRQSQVVELFWRGSSYAETAESLHLGMKTVEAVAGKLRIAFGVPTGLPAPWERGRRGRKSMKRPV